MNYVLLEAASGAVNEDYLDQTTDLTSFDISKDILSMFFSNLSEYSLELLIPTIRKNGSKLFFTWNPKYNFLSSPHKNI